MLKISELRLHAPPLLLAEKWDEPTVKAWWKRHRPDVVISTNPRELSGWLQRWGVEPPHGLGLVNLSCARFGDRVSGVYQYPENVGARAIDLLVDGVENNERGLPTHPNTLLVEGKWNEGETLTAR